MCTTEITHIPTHSFKSQTYCLGGKAPHGSVMPFCGPLGSLGHIQVSKIVPSNSQGCTQALCLGPLYQLR